MPPNWTVRCALDRRRSCEARCRAAPVSGNSQKAWIEIRGTGRSCGAAPKTSSLVLLMCLPLLDVRRRAGLLVSEIPFALVRRGDLALFVVADDAFAAHR